MTSIPSRIIQVNASQRQIYFTTSLRKRALSKIPIIINITKINVICEDYDYAIDYETKTTKIGHHAIQKFSKMKNFAE